MYGLCSVGHFTGTPMVFLGLLSEGALKEQAKELTPKEAASLALDALASTSDRCGVEGDEPYPARGAWVTICGHEPASVPLAPLVDALQNLGFYVALETTGRAKGHLGAGFDYVTIAPAPLIDDVNRVDFIDPEVMASADELRFEVGHPSDVEFALAMCAACPVDPDRIRTVTVQPRQEHHKPLAANAALRNGWRVGIFPVEASAMPRMAPDREIGGARIRRVDAASVVEEVLAARRRGGPLSS